MVLTYHVGKTMIQIPGSLLLLVLQLLVACAERNRRGRGPFSKIQRLLFGLLDRSVP